MDVLIYTKLYCPNCVAAKQLLKSKGIPYQEVDSEKGTTLEALMALHPEIKQMPAIFVEGQYVGGYAGLQAAMKAMGVL